jgi:Flp pilus assembly secretin CpaC
MGGWRPGRAVSVAVASIMLHACTGVRPLVESEPERKTFESAAASPGTDPVTADAERQTIRPEDEKPTSREGAVLQSGEAIWIPSGKTRVLQLRNPLKRVSIGDPSLAGIVVLGPRTIMINAKEAPTRPGQEMGMGSRTVGMVTGRTLTPEPRVGETTLVIWDGSATPDIHTLFIADFINQQVMLDVTVAELNRTAMEEHGIDFRNAANSFVSAYFMGGGAGPQPGGQQVLIPPQGSALLPLGTQPNKPTYAFNLPNNDITALIQLLQSEGLATVLAQPKILAMSGQNAVFQVGGEIPIRIATGFSTDVVFKPFGTIVNFVARVSDEGDILLTVTPEVSEPDFTSLVEGIPSFRTRRASTATRLRNGETLLVGGLLQHTKSENVSGVPYLQDIPYVGYVFRHTTYTSTVTELVVVATPHLVRPMPPGTEVALPTDRGPLTNEEVRTQANPYETTRPRVPGIP